MRAFLLLAATLLLCNSAYAEDLLKPGDTVNGILRLVTARHPNGTRINAYQIVSSHPLKFAAEDEFCGDDPPRTFHLVAMDDKAKVAQLKRRVGHKTSVVLESFFCSETAWHIGDAVSFQWYFAD